MNLNLYAFTVKADYGGGMIIIAANSDEEACALKKGDDEVEYIRTGGPTHIGFALPDQEAGVVTYDAHIE